MKLLLVGGAQGVGKTTLLEGLAEQFGSRLRFLDPGEIFRKEVYGTPKITAEAAERLIAETVASSPKDVTLVAHWHYAVPRPDRLFIPQISYEELARAVSNPHLERVVLLLLDAPLQTVLARRRAQNDVKKRALASAAAAAEIQAESVARSEHHARLKARLGNAKVVSVTIENVNLSSTRQELDKLVQTLLLNQ